MEYGAATFIDNIQASSPPALEGAASETDRHHMQTRASHPPTLEGAANQCTVTNSPPTPRTRNTAPEGVHQFS
jgi:hypothetical protein